MSSTVRSKIEIQNKATLSQIKLHSEPADRGGKKLLRVGTKKAGELQVAEAGLFMAWEK